MKLIFLLIFVAVSYAAGYLFEPSFRLQLTGKPADFKLSSAGADDDIPFELNPVDPVNPPDGPTTPPDGPTAPPDGPTNPDTSPTDPTTTPPSNPGVLPNPPENPVTNPDTPVQTADPVLVMKASIASGQISKFSAAQVLEWKAGSGSETIDGVDYQTGNVTYQAETPFGTKNLPAKALIKDGKVVRWISPKSGMQIE
jgi:hypothetical protein